LNEQKTAASFLILLIIVILCAFKFGFSLAGFLISLFLTLSHQDMKDGSIEPMELSDSMHEVSVKKSLIL